MLQVGSINTLSRVSRILIPPHRRMVFLLILVLTTYLNQCFAQKPSKITNLAGRTIKSNLKYNMVFPPSSFGNPLMDSILRSTKELDWETSFTEAGSDQIKVSRKLKRARLSMGSNPPFFDTDNSNALAGVLASNADHYKRSVGVTHTEILPKSEGITLSGSQQMSYLTHIKDIDTLNLTSSILFFSDLPSHYGNGTSWTDSSNTELYRANTTFIVQSVSSDVVVLNFKHIVFSKNDLSSAPSKQSGNVDLHSEIRINEKYSTAEGIVYIDRNTYLINALTVSVSKQTQSSINGVRDKDDTATAKFYLQNIIE